MVCRKCQILTAARGSKEQEQIGTSTMPQSNSPLAKNTCGKLGADHMHGRRSRQMLQLGLLKGFREGKLLRRAVEAGEYPGEAVGIPDTPEAKKVGTCCECAKRYQWKPAHWRRRLADRCADCHRRYAKGKTDKTWQENLKRDSGKQRDAAQAVWSSVRRGAGAGAVAARKGGLQTLAQSGNLASTSLGKGNHVCLKGCGLNRRNLVGPRQARDAC